MSMVSRVALALVALSTVAACATTPLATATEDAAAKGFPPPPAGEAALYVVREGVYQGAPLTTVSLGSRQIGVLAIDTYMRVDVPPGRYDVRAVSTWESARAVVDLQPNTIKVLSANMGMMRMTLSELPLDQGRASIASKQRAAEFQ